MARPSRRAKPSTTDKGLGWQHQQDAARLLRHHADGTPCWWCGLPRFKAPLLARNWDRKQLAADHSKPRAFGGQRADRLLHGDCNSQRQDGRHDDVRPVVLGVHPTEWAAALAARGITTTATELPTDDLVMDW